MQLHHLLSVNCLNLYILITDLTLLHSIIILKDSKSNSYPIIKAAELRHKFPLHLIHLFDHLKT